MRTRDIPSLEELDAALTDRLEALCEELFVHGERRGNSFYIGGLDGGAGRRMEINCSRGPKRGLWKDFVSDEAGRPLKLIAASRFGGDYKKAWRWAMQWLGWLDGAPDAAPRYDDEALKRRAAELSEKAAKEREATRRRAVALWNGAPMLAPGDPAWRYLAARGIDLARLQPQPRALRYLEQCYHAESDGYFPAMVALVVGEGGTQLGVHRTYLQPGRDDRLREHTAKLSYGPVDGGCIPLWRGLNGRNFFEPGADPSELGSAEGIEDGLSVALMRPEWRVASCMAVGFLGNVPLKGALGGNDLVWLGQNDPAEHPKFPGKPHPVHAALERQFQRLAERHIGVRKALPPEAFKDWNDLLQGKPRPGAAMAVGGIGDDRRDR
ncbi:DUF7146 domain-containing protein [Ferrovibrio sp.]|uniref:DUF7146 domain-containing protein n=1 Tax=Ferrovibrio sp. TaxID=1917215 RepID=UPI003D11D02D